MKDFITPEKKDKPRKRVVLDYDGKHTSIPVEFFTYHEYRLFIKSISKINNKPWYQYDFKDLDVISLFENEKK